MDEVRRTHAAEDRDRDQPHPFATEFCLYMKAYRPRAQFSQAPILCFSARGRRGSRKGRGTHGPSEYSPASVEPTRKRSTSPSRSRSPVASCLRESGSLARRRTSRPEPWSWATCPHGVTKAVRPFVWASGGGAFPPSDGTSAVGEPLYVVSEERSERSISH
jgi:hypothetical protein